MTPRDKGEDEGQVEADCTVSNQMELTRTRGWPQGNRNVPALTRYLRVGPTVVSMLCYVMYEMLPGSASKH
jgi:hypothetical protein